MYLTGRQPAVIKIEFNIWEPVAHREARVCHFSELYIFEKYNMVDIKLGVLDLRYLSGTEHFNHFSRTCMSGLVLHMTVYAFTIGNKGRLAT